MNKFLQKFAALNIIKRLSINQVLLLSVFVLASCGLAYELIMAALASYLLGDSILQFSLVIGLYLFSMGIGAQVAKYITDSQLLKSFIEIELLVGIIGGLSALFLFVAFGFAAAPFRSLLFGLVIITGIIVGMEIPLVMRILNSRKKEFKEVVSDVLTFDYVGALIVSILFPLFFAPKLGMARSAILFGIFNVLIAIITAKIFAQELEKYHSIVRKSYIVLAILVIGFIVANKIMIKAEAYYFGDPVVYAKTTPYQRLVVTKYKQDVRLYINGNLQFSSRDEKRYHEALVFPAMELTKNARRVLILGGGDGLAAREVLKYPQLEKIVLVDLDKEMTDLFSSADFLTKLNQNSLNNNKLEIINKDAIKYLEVSKDKFDVIIVDFPDPSNFSLGKLYSVPIYRLMKNHLNKNGKIVMQSTSPYFAPNAFWCVVKTLKEANLKVNPYHIYVPSFGEWGFILAGEDNELNFADNLQVKADFLSPEIIRNMFNFPPDMQEREVKANHLNNQLLVQYFEEDWREILR